MRDSQSKSEFPEDHEDIRVNSTDEYIKHLMENYGAKMGDPEGEDPTLD